METLRDFKLVKHAGFKQYELAPLFGVSRVTLSSWYHGKRIHPLAVKRADDILAGLARSIELRELPAKKGTPLAERIKILTRSMLATAQTEAEG